MFFLFAIFSSVVAIFFAGFFFLQKQLQNKDFQIIKAEKEQTAKERDKLVEENAKLKQQKEVIEENLQKKEIEVAKLSGELQSLKDNRKNQEELEKQMQVIFQNISNTTLEKQTEFGKQKIDEILKPFENVIKENINTNRQTTGEIKGKIDEMLKNATDIGDKADRLAKAFEGDKKGQGNFGELKFEELLNWYGFNEGENYFKQYLVKTEEQKNKYPDFILQAQPNKWLVVDSKFSVVAYTKYVNEQDIEIKQKYLTEYVNNLKDRIKELGEKEYHKLLKQNGKETFDFVCLFFGNEMAYLTAIGNIQYRQEIESLSRKYKVAILTASAFSPILQMIQQLWSVGKTNENIIKAREMIEKWLTKIADFNENMQKIGNQIDSVKKTYTDAVSQLSGKGSATIVAQDVLKLVDANLKPKNGKERKIEEPVLFSNIDNIENS